MSRVVKFRAFDKYNRHGHMGAIVEINFSKQECIVGFGDPDADNPEGWGSYASYGYAFSEVELLEFTGLFDRKGVEIYEGDIVKWHRSTSPPEIVKWHEGICGFEPFCLYDSDCDGTPTKEDHGEYEIIGNIYEHPNLLHSNAT